MKTRPFDSPQETPNGSEVAETAELKKRAKISKRRNAKPTGRRSLATSLNAVVQRVNADRFSGSFRFLRRKNRQFGSFANLRNASIPRSIVSTLAAYERRKHSSRRLKTFPGMMSVLYFVIAFSTNSEPVPQGAFGNI